MAGKDNQIVNERDNDSSDSRGEALRLYQLQQEILRHELPRGHRDATARREKKGTLEGQMASLKHSLESQQRQLDAMMAGAAKGFGGHCSQGDGAPGFNWQTENRQSQSLPARRWPVEQRQTTWGRMWGSFSLQGSSALQSLPANRWPREQWQATGGKERGVFAPSNNSNGAAASGRPMLCLPAITSATGQQPPRQHRAKAKSMGSSPSRSPEPFVTAPSQGNTAGMGGWGGNPSDFGEATAVGENQMTLQDPFEPSPAVWGVLGEMERPVEKTMVTRKSMYDEPSNLNPFNQGLNYAKETRDKIDPTFVAAARKSMYDEPSDYSSRGSSNSRIHAWNSSTDDIILPLVHDDEGKEPMTRKEGLFARRKSVYIPRPRSEIEQQQRAAASSFSEHWPSPLSPCTLRLQTGVKTLEEQAAASAAAAASSASLDAPADYRSKQGSVTPGPKRRRLDTNELMMLAMLTDTVVSPKSTKEILRASPGINVDVDDDDNEGSAGSGSGIDTENRAANVKNNNSNDGSKGNHPAASMLDSCMSPMQRPVASKESSLSPPNQASREEGSSMAEGTPGMFADFIFNTLGIKDETSTGGSEEDARTMMPPPPLYSLLKDSNKMQEDTDLHLDQTDAVGDSAEGAPPPSQSFREMCSPPLPSSSPNPVTKGTLSSAQRHPNKKQQKKKVGRPKKKALGRGPSAPGRHIITPSSAIISALSAEIRSKMTSMPSPNKTGSSGNGAAADANSKGDEEKDCVDGNPSSATFSVPQFASVMEASQTSQQSIHDWDRRMGLRRAHSKTMRESCRSRKRVLEFLRGEGAGLALLAGSAKRKRRKVLAGSGGGDSSVPASSESGGGNARSSSPTGTERRLLSSSEKSPKDEDGLAIASGTHAPLDKVNNPADDEEATGKESLKGVGYDMSNGKGDKGEEDGRDDERLLESMFRRASLDCPKSVLPSDRAKSVLSSAAARAESGGSPVAPSPPAEEDRKVFRASAA